jgi:hypothetical protein
MDALESGTGLRLPRRHLIVEQMPDAARRVLRLSGAMGEIGLSFTLGTLASFAALLSGGALVMGVVHVFLVRTSMV